VGKRTVRPLNDAAGTKSGPVFRVDVSCDCPWALDLRRRSTFSRLLGWADSVVATGTPELDAAVVVQDDDGIAVRHWLNDPAVSNNILSLFQQHKVKSVRFCISDSGPVLRSELATNNPFGQPTRDAARITAGLCASGRIRRIHPSSRVTEYIVDVPQFSSTGFSPPQDHRTIAGD
jgi:hypothetical protein